MTLVNLDDSKYKVIDGAAFSATVTSPDINVALYSNLIVLVTAGTKTNSPTLDVVIKVKDSNGNYITHTTFTQITAAGSALKELANFAGKTIQVVCTYGGTGNFAGTTVEVQGKHMGR